MLHFSYPRFGDLCAWTWPEEQASEGAPSPETLHLMSRRVINFWGAHQRDCSLRTTTSSTFRRRLYKANTCTASTLIGYIEQDRLAMSGNDASGSFETWVVSELHVHVYCFCYKHIGSCSCLYLWKWCQTLKFVCNSYNPTDSNFGSYLCAHHVFEEEIMSVARKSTGFPFQFCFSSTWNEV